LEENIMLNSENYDAFIEKQNRLYQAFSIVGNLVLPLEDEDRILDVMVEQLIRAARIRSLMLSLVYEDRNFLEVVRVASFNNLTEEGRLTPRSTPSIKRYTNRRSNLTDTDSIACFAALNGRIVIVDGKDKRVQSLPVDKEDKWEGKVAYFERLQYNSECVAVLAGACPLDEEATALDWIQDTMPLLELISAQLKTLRLLKEQRFLAYRPPIEVNLSAQENEVLRRVALGESATQIAEEMDLSPRTVHTYKRRICKKLDRYSQADLTRYAIMTGLIPLTDR
jgi:DNA-binding CsgD family transcriptional regulator